MKTNSSSFTPSNLKEGFKSISTTRKEELLKSGLTLEPLEKPTTTTLKISEVSNPPAFLRCDQKDDFNDLENVERLEPVKVASVEGTGFVVIDGLRRLEYLKRKGEHEVPVSISGKAICSSQVAMTRAVEMTKLAKPLTTLELVDGLLALRDLIVNEFGEDHFYSHGGDRKGDSRESLCTFIASRIGIKQTTVTTLMSFGTQVGTLALKGLLQMEDLKLLPIRSIHQCNARLKEINLRESIENLVTFSEGQHLPEEELKRDVAQTAANAIRDALNRSTNVKPPQPVEAPTDGQSPPDDPEKRVKPSTPKQRLSTDMEGVLSNERIKQVVVQLSAMKDDLSKLEKEIQHKELSESHVRKLRQLKESIINAWIQIELVLQEIIES